MATTNQKIKILYLITQSSFGGAQKYVFDLATNLDKQKFEVIVAAGGNGDLFEKLRLAGIKTVSLKWMKRETINPVTDIFGLFEIRTLIKKERPDVIHLNSSKAGFSGSLAAWLAGTNTKVVYTVHGAVFEAAFSKIVRKFFLCLEKFSSRFKDKIICVSEKDRQIWLEHKAAPAEKLVTIHNGINLYTNFLTREEARQKLFDGHEPTTKNYFLVGSIGYFYPEKNFSALVDAANFILKIPTQKQKTETLFFVIGDGQQKPLLESLIKKLNISNRFFLPGALPQANKYLKAFDVFALPSTKEGLPYTILEAMAAGVPIIASNVGGIPEMIQDKINGFLVHPNDTETLAEKILQILENPELAKEFVRASQNKIKEFSLEKMAQKTQDIYLDILGKYAV